MRVSKWGNSLAVRLPGVLVEAFDLKEGDEIDIHADGRMDLQMVRRASREELIERLRAYRGLLPADFKFDREEANAR